jgi:hypothetical protein
MQTDDLLLDKCRKLIEEKTGWGDSETWTNRDFTELSEKIFEQTKTNLSPTTLKRIWGKVKYDSLPNLNTLDALAHFSGYENWREFKLKNANGNGYSSKNGTEKYANPNAIDPVEKPSLFSMRKAGILAFLLMLFCAAWIGVKQLGRPQNTAVVLAGASFAFSSKPVTKGVPNSVIFTYDATAARTDSVYIQQSWDKARRFRVDKDKHAYTCIYYQPGFFKAKLVVGDSVVKEHDLFIPSDGWVTTVNTEPVPVYFPENEATRNGVLGLPVALIESRNIPMQPQPLWVSYSNVQRFDSLRSDNFVFETEVRHDYRQGSAVCQQTEITLLLENDAIVIPLSQLGCVSNLGLFIAGKFVDGKTTDLSAFGGDLSRWTKVRCEAKDKKVQLWVNGKKAFETAFPNPPARIIGIRYGFKGTGSVNYTRLSRVDGRIVFEEAF